MKEKEIRDRKVLERYLELVKKDSERIFGEKTDFISVVCPACNNDDYDDKFEKDGFNYVNCNNCKTLFVNPRPQLGDLMLIYQESSSAEYWANNFFIPVMEARREKIFRPRAEYIVSKFSNLDNRRIGDIGSGFGLFLEELGKILTAGDLVAIEPSKKMADICREKNLNVIESVIENIDPSENQFFMLTAFELFDHLHDAKKVLKRIHELLEPEGYLFLTALNSLGFDIQVLWKHSMMVCPPLHLNLFNTSSIEILLEHCGFEITEITTPGKLDWELMENGFREHNVDIGRFFKSIVENADDQSKEGFQAWLNSSNLSSHMQVIAKRGR